MHGPMNVKLNCILSTVGWLILNKLEKNVEGEVVVKLEILSPYLDGDTEASHENFGHNI
jgi:hypothetical protein